MSSNFSHYPSKPQSPTCKQGYVILCNAHDASSSFLDAFGSVRKSRKARGTPTDEEQDLLRAMLVFASAGLDSLIKQLIADALPSVLDQDGPATQRFRTYIEKRLNNAGTPDYKLIAEVMAHAHPRDHLVQQYVADLTSGSMQSRDAVFRSAAAFDIPSARLSKDPKQLQATFSVRNQIVHEMDVDFDRPNRNRCPRTRADMIAHTNRVFAVAKVFLSGVSAKAVA